MTTRTCIKIEADGRIVGRLDIDSAVPQGFIEVDPASLAVGAKPSVSHVLRWNGTTAVWADLRSVETARLEQWTSIKQAREELDNAPITHGAFQVDADAHSRVDIMGAIMAMQLGGPSTRLWRCSDNVMRELSLADLVAIGQAIAVRRQSLIETSDALWQQLGAATTVAQVEAVVWPTGQQ